MLGQLENPATTSPNQRSQRSAHSDSGMQHASPTENNERTPARSVLDGDTESFDNASAELGAITTPFSPIAHALDFGKFKWTRDINARKKGPTAGRDNGHTTGHTVAVKPSAARAKRLGNRAPIGPRAPRNRGECVRCCTCATRAAFLDSVFVCDKGIVCG